MINQPTIEISQYLSLLIRTRGHNILDNPQQLEGILLDEFPDEQHRAQIRALRLAVEDGTVRQMKRLHTELLTVTDHERLAETLETRTGLKSDLASWVISALAGALTIPSQFSSYNPPGESTAADPAAPDPAQPQPEPSQSPVTGTTAAREPFFTVPTARSLAIRFAVLIIAALAIGGLVLLGLFLTGNLGAISADSVAAGAQNELLAERMSGGEIGNTVVPERDVVRSRQINISPEIKFITAFKSYPTRKRNDGLDWFYDPSQMLDGDLNTAWSAPWRENTSAWINIELKEKCEIKGIALVPGYAKSNHPTRGSNFNYNYRLKKVLVELPNGYSTEHTFEDKPTLQTIPIGTPTQRRSCTSIKITVLSVYPTKADRDIAISELELIGY